MRATIPASPLAVATARTYGVGLLGYGLIVLIQGQERWSGPGLLSANALADPLPGKPSVSWGLLFAVAGTCVLTGSFAYLFRLRNAGLYGGAFLIGFLGLTAEYSATLSKVVSFAGGFLYVIMCVAICLVARAREVKPNAGRTQVP